MSQSLSPCSGSVLVNHAYYIYNNHRDQSLSWGFTVGGRDQPWVDGDTPQGIHTYNQPIVHAIGQWEETRAPRGK